MNLAKQWDKKSIFKIKGTRYAKFKYQKQKLRKKPICLNDKKNKVPRNKLYQGGERPVLRKLHNTEERN